MIKLESKRLILKTLNEKHAKIVLDYLSRNEKFFKPWGSEYPEGFFTAAFQKKSLRAIEQQERAGAQYRFFIFKKENENRIIGNISFSEVIKANFLCSFLGYKIDEHENNKGYATEAIARCVRYAFSELKLHRIEANIIPKNLASIRVVEKLGFVNEGLSKKYLKIDGEWQDHYHFALLNDAIE